MRDMIRRIYRRALVKRQSQTLLAISHNSCSCLLLPLLTPTLASAPSIASLPPVVTAVFLAIACKSVTTAKGEGCSGETVRQVDLCTDGVGEVRNDEDVLDVCVAARVSVSVCMCQTT